MPSDNYGPFPGGLIDTGSTAKCPCGKGNKHSLREAGACDWQRRTPEERAAIIAKREGRAA